MARILIIEDDNSVASALQDLLRAEGFTVEMQTDSAAGLAAAQNGIHDVVITDLQMPGVGGLEIIEQLQAAKPHLPVILITAFHTTEVAIRAIKLGAFDYILKPIDPTEFLVILKRALESTRLLAKPLAMGDATAAREAIIGKSRVMQEVYKEIGRVETRQVLLEVEDTGSGIAPEVQERLFDPFFSTKDNGTGLGLAIAAKIIEQHKGMLDFETRLGHGSVFRVTLPASSQ